MIIQRCRAAGEELEYYCGRSRRSAVRGRTLSRVLTCGASMWQICRSVLHTICTELYRFAVFNFALQDWPSFELISTKIALICADLHYLCCQIWSESAHSCIPWFTNDLHQCSHGVQRTQMYLHGLAVKFALICMCEKIARVQMWNEPMQM